MKCVRFGTPEGNVWLARDDQGRVGVAETKDAAKARAGATDRSRAVVSHVLTRYLATLKPPMLVVGGSNWTRSNAPFALIQRYDLHLLFYPNSTPFWVVGVVAIDRQDGTAAPIWSHAAGANSAETLKRAIWGILSQVDFDAVPATSATSKRNTWLTNWVYRCTKISLRDVLALDDYKDQDQALLEYERDGVGTLEEIEIRNPSPIRAVAGGKQ